jgi:hypothetical protein
MAHLINAPNDQPCSVAGMCALISASTRAQSLGWLSEEAVVATLNGFGLWIDKRSAAPDFADGAITI